MQAVLDVVIQGVLLGGLYGLYAAGLAVVFGVMRLVNVAHGDMIILSAFVAWVLQRLLGGAPAFLVLALLAPIMFGVGYGLQRGLLNRVVDGQMLRPVLITFGLSVMIQNGLLLGFTADPRRLTSSGFTEATLFTVGGVAVGALPVLMLASAVAVVAAIELVLRRTALGRAWRATSDDPQVAGLMGIDTRHIFAVATGVSMAAVAVASVFAGLRSSVSPSAGPELLVFAFEAVIIGGLGSLWGALLGGIVLGLAQALGARFSPDWQILAGHLVFLAALAVRPQGFLPRRQEQS